jgi:hypothetical protein
METERITLSQRERGRWKVLHEVQQMHRSQVGSKRSFLAVLKLNGASFQGSFVFAGLISSVKMSSV